MQTIALTSRKHATLLLLISTTEIKSTKVRAYVNILSTHADSLVTLRHYLIDRLGRVNILVLLVHIGQFHRLAYVEGACIGLFQTHDKTE